MKHKHTKEELAQAIASSACWAETCRKLNIPPATGSQSYLKLKATKLGIDFIHFKGYNPNRGKSSPKRRTPASYLGKEVGSHRLKLWLIRDGLKSATCEICTLSHWRGEPIVLELDHKNGDHYDNSLENLQILCPNCHASKTRCDRGKA